MDYTFNVYKSSEPIKFKLETINIIFVLEGDMTLFQNKAIQSYKKHSFFLIRPYQSTDFILNYKKIIVLSINALSFNRFALFNWEATLENTTVNNAIIHTYLNVIKSLYEKDNFNADINIVKLINYIRLSDSYKNNLFLKEHPLIKNIIAYIDSNYKKSLTVSAIASEFYVNTSYLSRLFSNNMNISLLAYIRKIKIYHLAADLISNPISHDIWKDYGYDSYETYLKHFKIVFSMSPSEFISNYKNNISTTERFKNINDSTYETIKKLLSTEQLNS